MKWSFPVVRRPRVAAALALGLIPALTACAGGATQVADEAPTPGALGSEWVTLLFVADLHAQLEEHPELFWSDEGERIETAGGFARLAQALRQERAQAPGASLVIDGGDTIQGSAVAAYTQGEAVTGLLDALGMDLMIPGNWEVAYGAAAMRARMGEVAWPVIAANVRDAHTGELLFAPTWLHDAGDMTLGFIGYTDPDVPERQPPSYSTGLTYDGPESLGRHARALREAGADVVVLVSHVGLTKAVALTHELEGIDLHLSADTHERTYEPIWVGEVPVVEPGAFGSFVGRMRIRLREGESPEFDWELVEVAARTFDEAPDVRARVDAALAPWRAQLDVELAHADAPLYRYDVVETTLDNLLADALRATTGTDIALSNGFRFGSPVPEGPITEADLWDFYPIVTRLKTGEVTGRQLLDFWERELENVFSADPERRFGGWVPRPSGMTLEFEAHAPPGERVRALRVAGEPVDPSRVYTITACEREGEADHVVCRIPHVTNPSVHEVDAHEAVRRWLRAHPVVRAPARDRVRALDLPAVVRSQALLPHIHEAPHGEPTHPPSHPAPARRPDGP